MPASLNPDELNDMVALIAAQQRHPDRRISYLGTDAAGIVAELDGLRPPWVTTARVLRDGTRITGAVMTEWDHDLGRAWIVGPWVIGDGDAWMAAAAALLDAALAELPLTVARYEMSGDIANHRLADLASPSPASSSNDRCSAGWGSRCRTIERRPGPCTSDSVSGPADRSSPTARGRRNDTSLVGRHPR